ncbi:MAG: hypothetical protein ABEJ67_05900 [Halanaeroarchaeum sp.]
MRRVVVLVLITVLVGQAAVVGTAAGSSEPSIVRTMSFSLTPADPGTVAVEVEYDVPDNVVSLSTTVPEDATVTSTDGFSVDDGEYTWDGGEPTPSLTLSVPANETGSGLRAADGAEGYEFVDVGPWAIVSTPPMSTEWSYRGAAPGFERVVRTATEGVAGRQMVYLGPSTEYRRTAGGQTMTLVVPDAANLEESPGEILDSLAGASTSFRVGERDPSVLFIAAPGGVGWGAQGLAADADAWVIADQPLDDPNNVWIHEYVHTRTAFDTTESARWLVEASAEYYSALFTLQQGRIDFERFHDHLQLGSRSPYASSILTQPSTWARGANYLKGGLVLGNLDRRMRLATESSHPAADLLRVLNEYEGKVTHTVVGTAVEDLAGTRTAAYLDRYATTRQAPEMWTRDEHADAFDTLPPRMIVESIDTVAVSGPYRTGASAKPIVLVPGERLTVNATLRNAGDVAGSYDVELTVDGAVRDRATGTLGGRDSTSVTLSATFDAPGTYRLSVGERSVVVTVEPLASPRVTALSAPTTPVDPGGSVTLTVEVTNPTGRPAGGSLPVRVDGVQVGTVDPALAGNETTTLTTTVTLETTGTHTISVGEQSVRVEVDAGDGDPGTATTVPGMGPVTTVAALVLALSLHGMGLRRGQS